MGTNASDGMRVGGGTVINEDEDGGSAEEHE
jgi:hypothetical protein